MQDNYSTKNLNSILNTQDQILVSVVMPVFNHHENKLQQAIKSILEQSYQNIEFIIVDGCKSNKNFEIIQRFNSTKISYYKTCGYTNCLNVGLQHTKGKYIARADSDDISYPNRIEQQVDFLEKNKDIDVCSVQTKIFGDSLKHYSTNYEKNVTFNTLITDFHFNHPFVMFRKELNLKYSPYKPAEDRILFLDVITKGHKISNLPQVLGAYRMNANSLMNTFPLYNEFLISKIQIYYLSLYYNVKLSFADEILSKKHFNPIEVLEFVNFTKEIMNHIKTDKKKLLKFFRIYFKYILDKSNNKLILHTMLLFNINAYRFLRYYKLVLKTLKLYFYRYVLFKGDMNNKM